MSAWLLVRVLVAVVTTASLAGPAGGASAPAGVPTRQQWLADVHQALAGAPAYVRAEAAQAASGERLALNLDIDNTAIASFYDGGGPILEVRRLTRIAHRHGVAVLFNTARDRHHRHRTLAQLRGAGYRVDGLCMRRTGETKVHGKQRCRAYFASEGYTLIANLGNNATDFAGHGYDRAFRLPNYDGRLP